MDEEAIFVAALQKSDAAERESYLRQACGDAVVILSADLQDPVELIADMIAEWRRGNQIVVCYRIAREDTLSARAASWRPARR